MRPGLIMRLLLWLAELTVATSRAGRRQLAAEKSDWTRMVAIIDSVLMRDTS